MNSEVKNNIRQQQLRIFDAFTKRALTIVEDHKSAGVTLADASRLVETALKAIEQHDSNNQANDAADADRKFVADIARIYNPKNPISEEAV